MPGFIVGLPESEAQATLGAQPYGFQVTSEYRSSATIDEGIVMETDPGAGTIVERGGPVTIVVSSGPEPVTVPVVAGLTEGSARNTLIDAGLTVAPTQYQTVEAGSPDDGRVVGQTPQPGEQVEPGTTVTITVGRADVAVTTLPPITSPPTTPAPETTTTDATTTTEPPSVTEPPADTTGA
jgi:serine/threonine-protein kinase